MKRLKGTISIFLLMIIVSVYCLGGTLVDITRYGTAKSMILTADNAALDSCLTLYLKPLKETYGLFAFEQTDTLENTFEMHLLSSLHDETAQSLYGFDVGQISLTPTRSLSEYQVLRRQILEFSKYRYAVKLAEEVVVKLKALFKLMKVAKHFGGYVDVKQQESGLIEKDMDVQEELHKLKEKGSKPEGFDMQVTMYQDRYPELVDEIEATEIAIENLNGEIESMQERYDEMDDEKHFINDQGEPDTKPNQAKKNLGTAISNKESQVKKKKDELQRLKDEREQLVSDTRGLIKFYTEIAESSQVILKRAEQMMTLIPPLVESIIEKDGLLKTEKIESETPGTSIHNDYVNMKNKYSEEKLNTLIGVVTANVDVCNQVIEIIENNTNNPPPITNFADFVKGQVGKYSTDFEYYQPPVFGVLDSITQKSEIRQFTKNIKCLMEAIENRITVIADSVTGKTEDPLKPYPDYAKLPSFEYGHSKIEDENKPYKKDAFTTKSSILGTDVKDSSSGLDLFRTLGEAGTDFTKEGALEDILSSSMDVFEEALINEYILDHFNAACVSMQEHPGDYWSEGEVEYVLYGSKSPRRNIQYTEASIFTIRLLPNTMSYFVYKKTEMDVAAKVCSAPFPPMLPVFEVAFPILAGTLESLADVKMLHGGENIPLFKMEDDLLLDFEFKNLVEINQFLSDMTKLIGTGDSFHSIPVSDEKGNTPTPKLSLNETDKDSFVKKPESSDDKVNLGDFNIKFDYEDYLRLLLFTMSFSEESRRSKIMRVADLMHMNLEKNVEDFNFGKFYTGLNSQVGLNMDLWFISSEIYREMRVMANKQLIQIELERGY